MFGKPTSPAPISVHRDAASAVAEGKFPATLLEPNFPGPWSVRMVPRLQSRKRLMTFYVFRDRGTHVEVALATADSKHADRVAARLNVWAFAGMPD